MIIKKEAKKEKSFRIPNYVIGSGIAGGALGGLLANPSVEHVNMLNTIPGAISKVAEGTALGSMAKGIADAQAPMVNESILSGTIKGAGIGALGSVAASALIGAIKNRPPKLDKEVVRMVEKPHYSPKKYDNRDSALAVIPTSNTALMV